MITRIDISDEGYFYMWKYWKIKDIVLEISDILDYETIKINDGSNCIQEYRVPRSSGMKCIYKYILDEKSNDNKPEVWVHDIKTRVLKYRIE